MGTSDGHDIDSVHVADENHTHDECMSKEQRSPQDACVYSVGTAQTRDAQLEDSGTEVCDGTDISIEEASSGYVADTESLTSVDHHHLPLADVSCPSGASHFGCFYEADDEEASDFTEEDKWSSECVVDPSEEPEDIECFDIERSDTEEVIFSRDHSADDGAGSCEEEPSEDRDYSPKADFLFMLIDDHM